MNRFSARPTPLKARPKDYRLPESVRLDILELNRVAQQAQREVGIAFATACKMLGLEPMPPGGPQHGIDLTTGVITPATVAHEPEPTSSNGTPDAVPVEG